MILCGCLYGRSLKSNLILSYKLIQINIIIIKLMLEFIRSLEKLSENWPLDKFCKAKYVTLILRNYKYFNEELLHRLIIKLNSAVCTLTRLVLRKSC